MPYIQGRHMPSVTLRPPSSGQLSYGVGIRELEAPMKLIELLSGCLLYTSTAFACAGLVGAMILSRIDYRIWRKYICGILGFACFLLVLCYVPGIGKEINGERRWITIGMQFQPSECAKLCMMIN